MMLTDKELQTLRNQGNDDAADEIESLRAKLEVFGQQKPVFWGPRMAILNQWDSLTVRLAPARETDIPLYLAAGVQPVVPDGWQLVPIDPTSAMLDAAEKLDWSNEDVRGNCCNQWYVMLAASSEAKTCST